MVQAIKKWEFNELTEDVICFYEENKDEINPATGLKEIIKIFNEGSSRSGKTFSAFDFILYLCDRARKNPISIYVIRKTLKSCREKTYYEDFVGWAKNVGVYHKDFTRGENSTPEFTLFGSTIKFIGLDNDEELGRSDVLFFNEMLDHNDEKAINNMIMRCEIAVIGDWNPKLSYHFIFNREGQFNTLFTKTTFMHNRFLNEAVRAGLMAKSPYDFADFCFEDKKWLKPKHTDRLKYTIDGLKTWTDEEKTKFRLPNEYNILNRTANEHEWTVYGEGERCPEEGAVFKDIIWIDKYPDEAMDETAYGLDFGFTNDPSVLTRVGRKGKDLYIEYLAYQKTPDPDTLFHLIEPIILSEIDRLSKYEDGFEGEDIIISCESNDKFKDFEFVRALNSICCERNYDWSFYKIKKPSIHTRLQICKRFNLHVVQSEVAKNEFNNYVYIYIEGRETNIPIGKWNHGIDSFGYAVYDRFRHLVTVDL